MGADAVVVRHGASGAPHRLAHSGWVRSSVVNAGDGTHEHPTQALLDAFTMWRHLGDSKPGGLEGRRVAIVGDVLHSRVARSNAKLLKRLGADLRFAGPPSLMPDGIGGTSIDEAVEDADVVMMLRVQRERLEDDLGDEPGEFLARHGLTERRFAKAAPEAVVMHPGPINRGVEIEGSLADHASRSLIVRQVEMGVAVRMACLDLLTADRRV